MGKNLFFIHSHVHTLIGPFLPRALLPLSPRPMPPRFQAEPVLPVYLILGRQDISNNEKDKEVLLVELRIPIQRDS
jgi:hypothetical protein